jgi:hypothetical protein
MPATPESLIFRNLFTKDLSARAGIFLDFVGMSQKGDEWDDRSAIGLEAEELECLPPRSLRHPDPVVAELAGKR